MTALDREYHQTIVSSDNFITIDDSAISLKKAISYLNATGDLPNFIQRILHRHVLEQHLQDRPDVQADPQQVEQAVVNFRVQNRLSEPGQFEQWLKSQNLTYEVFRDRAEASLRAEKIKQEVVSEKVQAYFNENKEQLDRVVLSRIVVLAGALADDIRKQVEARTATFESLAKQHSVTNDSNLNGLMGAIQLGQLPPPIREQLRGRDPGNLVGPVEVEGRYTLLRVEQWLPAVLEGNLKRQLDERFFTQWLQEQLQNKQIKLNID
ncbi:MAG: peptidylprolyl isomerase [Cyanobacteria bacterium SID2]|nr:peptidylprolyl isomerase [Cyanobacteria bacterium SID2]MBP0003298.1 peptidylprolyl isomerase [Cyanobacteria bacterium SBC]